MFEFVDTDNQAAVIKVIGVGGGGGNAVQHMLSGNIEGVEFICANTDAQALNNSDAKTSLQLGRNITKGLGAGADPEIGRQAALEDRDRVMDLLEGADMVFITAGMGGGTGTGAAPIVAQVAKEMGILTVAVVTRPFSFEGKKRAQIADDGINELGQFVDSLITIPNEKLLAVLGRDISLLNAFGAANDVLLGAVQGIAELITCPGLINVDFADVKTVMSEMGMAMMGSGKAQGEDRATVAAETDEVGNTVKQFASENATVVVGTVIDPDMSGEMRVTIVATGLGQIARDEAARVKLVQNVAVGDYKEFDRPTVIRNQNQETDLKNVENDSEYLDIPAFLRRQAD
jgi:cell division protein FtsZ